MMKTGQSVKVKKGTPCPDAPEYDLSGWQGRIVEVSEEENGETLIGIAWDSITLKEIPESYIEQSEADGLDWPVMYLYASEVDLAAPRDSEYDAEVVKDEMLKAFGWLGIGEEGKRIQAVVNSAKSRDDWDVMKAWEKHFRKNLTFPFDGVVYEPQDRGSFKVGDRLKVLRIEIVDEDYGIIVSCKAKLRKRSFPLADLAALDEQSDNVGHIRDYRVWFANR